MAPASRLRFRIATSLEMELAARRLRRIRGEVHSLSELVDATLGFQYRDTFIRPLQLSTEATRLLEIVAELRPARVIEIGTASGGTLFLFASVAAPQAHLISLDWIPWRDHPCNPTRLRLYRGFAREGQVIEVLDGDSHDPALPGLLERRFGGAVDFLFVDGDHSYEGVRLDAERFLPLLRKGGVAAFHDIVPDSSGKASGVAQWWREFSATREVEEIVESPDQASYGIGVWRRS